MVRDDCKLAATSHLQAFAQAFKRAPREIIEALTPSMHRLGIFAWGHRLVWIVHVLRNQRQRLLGRHAGNAPERPWTKVLRVDRLDADDLADHFGRLSCALQIAGNDYLDAG